MVPQSDTPGPASSLQGWVGSFTLRSLPPSLLPIPLIPAPTLPFLREERRGAGHHHGRPLIRWGPSPSQQEVLCTKELEDCHSACIPKITVSARECLKGMCGKTNKLTNHYQGRQLTVFFPSKQRAFQSPRRKRKPQA